MSENYGQSIKHVLMHKVFQYDNDILVFENNRAILYHNVNDGSVPTEYLSKINEIPIDIFVNINKDFTNNIHEIISKKELTVNGATYKFIGDIKNVDTNALMINNLNCQ
jgi:SMC interacting uncharacterized protein involved in chromosome segregation